MSEKKKEEHKERKPLSVFNEFSIISSELSKAIQAQTEIFASVGQSIQSVTAFESLKLFSDNLSAMKSFNDMIRQNQIVIQTFEISTPALKAMLDFGTQVKKVAEDFANISKTIGSMKIAEVSPILFAEIATVPSRNNALVDSLLREIDFLEKELAKEKTKNKELLKLLDNKRKELKEQYIA